MSQPVRRDCSCRGSDASFFHLNCIVEYAKLKTIDWVEDEDWNEDTEKLVAPWQDCLNCKQPYQNGLAVGLGNEFVSFVGSHYPDNHLMLIEALYLKLYAFIRMVNSTPRPELLKDGKETAIEMLSVIGKMKAKGLTSDEILYFEANAYNCIGLVTEARGTKVDAQEAIQYYKKALDIFKRIHHAAGIAAVESSILKAKTKYGGENKENKKEQLNQYQKIYELAVETFGQDTPDTIYAGVNLAIALWNSHRGIEAERLLIKLSATSKQASPWSRT